MTAPEKINKPFPGKPIDGPWLFEDPRIVADLTQILAEPTGQTIQNPRPPRLPGRFRP